MKISYVCPTNHVRRPIAELAMLLAEKGNSVAVAYPNSKKCSTKNWAPNRKLVDSERGKKVKKILIPSFYLSSLRYNVPKPFLVFSKLREIFKADVVHLWEYWYPICVLVIFYALFTGQRSKLIMTTDGFVGYSYKPLSPKWLVPAFRIYTRFFAWFLFRIPRSLTTYGKSMLPYAKMAGVPMKKISVISTGIDLNRFQNVKSSDLKKVRKELGILKDEKVVLFVGMLTERKGIKTVIEVGKRLIDDGVVGRNSENFNSTSFKLVNFKQKVKVIIVGDHGGKSEGLANPYLNLVPKNLGSEAGSSQIIFTGGRKDIPVLMKLADVLLLPSEGEGLPGVVMEAMGSGTAAVASKEGCTPDLIDSGKNGFLVNFGDVDGYYTCVLKVLMDSKKYGDRAFKKIEKFGWEKVVDKYLKFYSVMLARFL